MQHKFDEIFSVESLLRAHRKALKGKRDNQHATEFDCHLVSNVNALRGDLMAGRYEPQPYRRMTIMEPKERRIEAPAYRDRLVHHALHAHLNPIYERHFIRDSYACRTGRGTHHAARRVQTFLRSSAQPLYVCQIDISKYYASINHQRLKELLARTVTDQRLLGVLGAIIDSTDSGHEHDHLFAPDSYFHTKGRRGIPIGNLTSQLFANIYLHEADKFAKQRLKIRKYARYMDDILIFHSDKAVLSQYRLALVEFLYEQLYLTINPRKVRVYPAARGVDFVGFRILPYRTLLRSTSIRRFRRRQKRNLRALGAGRLKPKDFEASFAAWRAHAGHTSSQGLVDHFERQRDDYLWAMAIGRWYRRQQRRQHCRPRQLRLFDDK